MWNPYFLETCANEGQIHSAHTASAGLTTREGRVVVKKSHANTCAAYMRSSPSQDSSILLTPVTTREARRCFLVFSEFTFCRIEEFRNFLRSCPAKTSALPLKHFLVLSVRGGLALLDKGMDSIFCFFLL